jgi:antirestriction protein
MTDVSNTDDIIDSRDVIARIEELMALEAEGETPDEDDAAELKILCELAAEAEPYSPDWRHGETLIRDSYFEQYAEQLAEDIGAIDPNAKWPLNCIDWEAAADQLRQDYTAVEFDGVTYWIR